jgi:two-component system nitrogen regulation response regulator NtrX
VLTEGLALKPDLPFIMISGHGTVETAVEASKKARSILYRNHRTLTACLLPYATPLTGGAWLLKLKY